MADGDYTLVRECTSCKIQFPVTAEFFHAQKKSPDGRRAACKACRAKAHAENRATLLPKRREHYQENKDRISAENRAYYANNADAQRESASRRYHANRNNRVEQMREYRAANLDELNARRRPRSREAFHARYGVDLEFTLKHRVRSLLRVTLKRGRNGRRMADLLGYTVDELRAHIERQFLKGMTWERFMAGGIHIDHIIPLANFGIVDEKSDGFKQCWSLCNLRPMWAGDNLSKQDKVMTLL